MNPHPATTGVVNLHYAVQKPRNLPRLFREQKRLPRIRQITTDETKALALIREDP
jgi:hypothetical protein